MHQVVPDDNSCLFTSIGVVCYQDTGAAQKLRQGIVWLFVPLLFINQAYLFPVVADAIREDVGNYTEVVLGWAPRTVQRMPTHS